MSWEVNFNLILRPVDPSRLLLDSHGDNCRSICNAGYFDDAGEEVSDPRLFLRVFFCLQVTSRTQYVQHLLVFSSASTLVDSHGQNVWDESKRSKRPDIIDSLHREPLRSFVHLFTGVALVSFPLRIFFVLFLDF